MALVVIPPSEAFVFEDATPSPLDSGAKPSTSVLGYGLSRPFKRDNKNDFTNAGDVTLVMACVGQILGLRCSSANTQGELEWDPERGSLLYLLRQQKNDMVLQELGRAYVVDALQKQEPRIVVKGARITRETVDGQETAFVIRLVYDVITANVPGNAVLFSNVDQTIRLPTAA